ncbi:hypothetical protein HMPREF3156_02397 [Neisseria sp. HMSC06F02]|nr:hypothetical protein HMPREF3156_02397 [Neisseria sp. HMSC06F02]
MSDFDYLNDGFRGQSPRYLSYPKSVLIEYTGRLKTGMNGFVSLKPES